MTKRIAVVGAGMAGLSAAYRLAQDSDISVTLFEATERLGGTVETVTVPSSAGEPFVIECGPDSWVSEKPAARELAVELGLGSEIIYSNDARRRNYLARGRTLTPMPDGMRMMAPTRWAPILESPLFSWQARLAYLREPARAEELKAHALAQPEDFDESVASFVRRHFGEEATETIAGPLLAGIFGGDIERLSARAVLAPFVRMEREHGSLIKAVRGRAAREQADPGGAPPIFTTLRSGLGTLVDRMASSLGEQRIRRRALVVGVRARADARGWRLELHDAARAEHREECFDGIVLATPAHVTRALLAPLDPDAAELLSLEMSSAIAVALAYEPQDAGRLRIPRGFGFLAQGPAVPADEQPSLLAGTFMDQKFSARAPAGGVLLRGFFGGDAALRMAEWPDEQIVKAARAHFSRLLGPLPQSGFSLVRHWPRSLPQYAVGHVSRMHALEARMERLPGLVLTGNAYHGVGLPNLIEHGRAVADRLSRQLFESPVG